MQQIPGPWARPRKISQLSCVLRILGASRTYLEHSVLLSGGNRCKTSCVLASYSLLNHSVLTRIWWLKRGGAGDDTGSEQNQKRKASENVEFD